MKEIGQSPTLQEISFSSYHHHFGPSPLETLPEEDGDIGEDCDDFSRSDSPLTPDYLWAPSSSDLSEGDSKLQPTIRHEIERQRAKVLLLESTIGQLQEELRESKDQNELLEFRLLELGDLEGSTASQTSRVKRCSRRKSVDSEDSEEGELGSPTSQAPSSLYETEVSSPEVTQTDERTNGHANVTEARSTCSDCSESLSFQESGIFESQFPEDSFIRRLSDNDLSGELGRLVSQLEDLTHRFRGDDVKESKLSESKVRLKGESDLSYEFLLCRQRIQEFERKVRKHGNIDYVQSLETKISLLLSESQKLEEEKAELEEAENDSRNLCQRYEEKLKRTKQKKRNLEMELGRETEFLHQMRLEMQNFDQREKQLKNQNYYLETKCQIQEQQNFELEETNMELRDSIQFILQSIPVLLAWYDWKRKVVPGQRSRPLALPPLLPNQSLVVQNSFINDKPWNEADPVDTSERSFQTNSLSSEKLIPTPGLHKYAVIQECWDALLKALDEFEDERRGKNMSQLAPPKPKLKGTLVANRIRSLFPAEISKLPSDESSAAKVLKVVNRLQERVREFVQKRSHKGQKNLTAADDQENIGNRNEQVLYLTAENNRLRVLLNEDEQSWAKVEKLEDDNAQLRVALTTAIDLKTKLDESRAYAQRMMNRVEDLEQSEMIWREKVKVEEQKEKKFLERIGALRSENEFLAGKISGLQDQLEAQLEIEVRHKQEIQFLQAEVKEAVSIGQEKEEVICLSEAQFAEQFSKLESQLVESQRELGELECSNGMLREEVLYFEKTLAEVTERGNESEKLVQILNSKKDELEKKNHELKIQLTEADRLRRGENDLEAFAKNEGGLRGVSWHVKDAMTTIENCLLCKSTAGLKLREVSEQLNTLTMMLEGGGGSHAEGHHSSLSLSRCESEEHLSSVLMGTSITKWTTASSPLPSSKCYIEENKVLRLALGHLEAELERKEEDLRKLSEKQKIQNSQLKGLDEIRLRREKDLKESHLNESWWWKVRCDEKNQLIQILAKRLVYLSASDILGRPVGLLEGILREIRTTERTYPVRSFGPGESSKGELDEVPLDTTGLLTYFETERTRIRDLLQSCTEEAGPNLNTLDFRVLQRISDDALLVSWCANPSFQTGYEISVNGETYIKVPTEGKCRALLFGLNMTDPLQLSLKVENVPGRSQETSITYIA